MSHEFAKELVKRAARLGMTINGLANKSKVNRSAVYSWIERGKFDQSQIAELCRAIEWDVDVAYLEAVYKIVWTKAGKAPGTDEQSDNDDVRGLSKALFDVWKMTQQAFAKTSNAKLLRTDLLRQMNKGDFRITVVGNAFPVELHHTSDDFSEMATALRRGAMMVYLFHDELRYTFFKNWHMQSQALDYSGFLVEINEIRAHLNTCLANSGVSASDVERIVYRNLGLFNVSDCPVWLPTGYLSLYGTLGTIGGRNFMRSKPTVCLSLPDEGIPIVVTDDDSHLRSYCRKYVRHEITHQRSLIPNKKKDIGEALLVHADREKAIKRLTWQFELLDELHGHMMLA